MGKLTEKNLMFCYEYVKDFNASRSAKDAGYSERTAYSTGHELLKKPEVQAKVQELKKEIVDRNKITVDECIQALAFVVRADVLDLYEDDGQVKPISEMKKETRLAISSLDVEEIIKYGKKIGKTSKIRFLDKINASVSLLRYFGAFEKENEQKRPLMPIVGMSIKNSKSE